MMEKSPLIVQVQKLSSDAQLPEYATDGSACFDIRAYLGKGMKTFLHPLEGPTKAFNTGLAFEVPEDHVMLIFSRSGHGFNSNVRLANCVGVIDSDYRGELMVKLTADGANHMVVAHGDKIAQGLILPIPQVQFIEIKEVSSTERGAGGFGSTDLFKEVK